MGSVNLYLRMLWLFATARLRRPASLWDVLETRFRVWPTDLDVLGHMNNGKYLTIMDLARMDLMLRSGTWARLTERGWYPVVAGQTITYRRSLQPFERFRVRTRVLGADDRWFYLEQTFLTGREGTVSAQAVVRARFLKKTGGSVEVEELYELAGRPAHDLEVPAWVTRWTEDTRTPAQG